MALPLWNDPDELERRLRAVEPAVRLVPERTVRRVLHLLNDAGGDRVLNPELPVWASADFLRAADVLPPDKLPGVAGDVLLISQPDDRRVKGSDDPTVLRHFWGLLFRAVVQRDLSARASAAGVERWAARLPEEVIDEVRYVLETDHAVRPGKPLPELYPIAVATTAGLLHFDPDRLHDVFPSAEPDALADSLADLDARAVAERLRPAGATDHPPVACSEPPPTPVAPVPDASDEAADADRVARLGNYARAAVQRVRAARTAVGGEREQLERSAQSAIRNGVVKGLARALGLDDVQAEAWFRAVWPFVRPAADGTWPHAAKALYDLQRLAADIRDRLYAVTPVEWLLSLGRHPVRRPLDRARDVILLTRLTRVEKHVLRANLSDADRDRLLALLHAEMASAEGRIRRDLGPVIRDVFDRVGLTPTNLPERVARDKVVAELLDRACERGYLRVSDLRDAIARNPLKLADLSGPVEFARGDALLRADALLADELFGVYHRGEIYLRWIQRFSAVAFGTPSGRFVTKYLAIPFGGAFLGLEFLQHLLHGAEKAWGVVRKLVVPETPVLDVAGAAGAVRQVTAPPPGSEHHGPDLVTWPAVVAVGVVLLALIHVPAVRGAAARAASGVWRLLGMILLELPLAVWRSSVVRAVRRSIPVRMATRYLGAAILTTALTVALLAVAGASPDRMVRWGAVVFVATAILANTPFGRRLADQFSEALSDTWRAVWANLVPGIVGWFLWVFRELLGALDRVLYTVDEKLRYREGASRPTVAAKVVLTLLWFPIAYVVRFAFYLLIEPQVNPVKHFPVVTVSHKVIVPLAPEVMQVTGLSEVATGAIITGIPGIFGFLVWELKENWRLYASNRPAALRPTPVGHHGESGRGLLRPGFHSGTVPKLYRKLRAGWVDGVRLPGDRAANLHHDLHHIEVALRRLCERELFPLLAGARPTVALRPVVAGVHLGCQHFTIRIGLEGGELDAIALVVRNDRHGVTGGVASWGWAAGVGPEQEAVIRTGIDGLLCRAAAKPGEEIGWREWVEFWSKRETVS